LGGHSKKRGHECGGKVRSAGLSDNQGKTGGANSRRGKKRQSNYRGSGKRENQQGGIKNGRQRLCITITGGYDQSILVVRVMFKERSHETYRRLQVLCASGATIVEGEGTTGQ